MRRSICAIAATLAAAGAVGASSTPGAPRPRTVASYCSATGDVCFGAINRSGALYLELTTFARYFGRYRLCVRPPGGGAPGAQRCGSYPISRRGSLWGSSVKFAKNFPNVGAGTYRATWKLGAQPLGPTLRFRLPLTA